jgi:hypothetical protein
VKDRNLIIQQQRPRRRRLWAESVRRFELGNARVAVHGAQPAIGYSRMEKEQSEYMK